ncbi:hypothetical protein CO2235_MP10383 [Cupriavidus oxalaticus]|uniref:FAD-binding domain-containing protein n=1 Tax=Cupriavidus oxalaticus TaxID=96344 RepID=A0A375GA07_9BURK|nr:hypothetical protein CO2235_U1010051 [Cupriavidus oxalaticus]SPC18201.1 hypothetical protein CO2235_MP10383 [Cupriavidus oxalaticus]
MKIAIIGGGPSGLFLSILLKERLAEVDIDIYEQNPEDATFGFGVVLADTGLSSLRAASPTVVDELARAMRFSDRHSIVSHEFPITMKRPGAGGGAIPRIRLLQILQARARELGVRVTYNQRISDFSAIEADLVVGADGVNSLLRGANEAGFGTRRHSLTNHFAWYGVEKSLPEPGAGVPQARGRLLRRALLPVFGLDEHLRCGMRPPDLGRFRHGVDDAGTAPGAVRAGLCRRAGRLPAGVEQLGVAPVPGGGQRYLACRQPGADRRCANQCALLDRLRHAHRHGGCDRAGRCHRCLPGRRAGGTAPLRHRAPSREGKADPRLGGLLQLV